MIKGEKRREWRKMKEEEGVVKLGEGSREKLVRKSIWIVPYRTGGVRVYSYPIT